MQKALLRALFAILVLGPPGQGKDWPVIPPETWSIKQGPGANSHGAVILDEWVRYGIRETEVRRRIRIFGEAGKAAAALPAFNRIYELEGRTVLPDGQVTPFNQAKDLVTATIKVGHFESKQESLIPPGLTSDCVVDLYYRTGTYLYGTWTEIPILKDFPVQTKVMEMANTSPMSSALIGLVDLKAERVGAGSYDSYKFMNLPAYEQEDYTLPTARERPRFLFFMQPFMLRTVERQGPDAYWKDIGIKYCKWTYVDEMSFGSTYREWSRELRSGLLGDPFDRAKGIQARLEAQIQNGSQLTTAELAALPKKAAEEQMRALDLDASVKRRRASSSGMHYLFFQLLSDEGLHPKLLLVADRDQRAFIYKLPNIYQFTDVLIGVESSSGGTQWFDPARRFFPAGILSPDFQGTKGLLVDPKDWSCKPISVGVQVSNVNQSRYEYELKLVDEEAFSVKASYSGYPDYKERLRFYPLEPKEQERNLKEELESRLKSYTITKIAVDHALDGAKNLSWTAEGVKELEEGRRREFPPFPGLRYPLAIPGSWPEKRTIPIVIPYCRQFTAVSRFKVPQGWSLGKDPDIIQGNDFGTVSWQVKETSIGDEKLVEVIYAVEVKRMYADPSAYSAFRAFLAWIESASRRTLALDRTS